MTSSRGSSQPRDQSTSPVSPTLAGRFSITAPSGKSMINLNLSFSAPLIKSLEQQQQQQQKTSLGANCV